MSPLPPARPLVGLLVATVLAASGCTGGSGGEAPDQPADVLAGLGPSQEVAPADLAALVDAGDGQLTTARVTTTIEAAGRTSTYEGVIDHRSTPAATSGTLLRPSAAGPREIEVRMVEGVLYVRDPQVSADGFVRVAPAEDGVASDLLAALDPSAAGVLDLDDATSVRHVGAEDSAGTTLHHVRARGPDPAGDGDVVVELWLDSTGVVHRYRATSTRGGVERIVTSAFTDLGAEVDITAPADDEVLDAG